MPRAPIPAQAQKSPQDRALLAGEKRRLELGEAGACGADDLWKDGAVDEGKVRGQLILYCGVISGTLNFASMMPMANRLQAVLDKAAFDYTEEERNADILEIESASADVDSDARIAKSGAMKTSGV